MIALSPFHITTPRSIDLKLPTLVAQDLDLYRRLYKETYGAEVSEPDLIREILRVFLDGEDAFRQYKQSCRPNSARGRARLKTPAAIEKLAHA
jgi:hypothetical protein